VTLDCGVVHIVVVIACMRDETGESFAVWLVLDDGTSAFVGPEVTIILSVLG